MCSKLINIEQVYKIFLFAGDTLPNAELCVTANDVYADECVNDRQSFVTFVNWDEMSAEEIARRTERVRGVTY